MHPILLLPYTPSAVLFGTSVALSLVPMPYVRILPLFLFFLLWPFAAWPDTEATIDAQLSPQELVQQAVQNGLRQPNNEQIRWSYRETVRKDGRIETHEICQTSAGDIDRLVA